MAGFTDLKVQRQLCYEPVCQEDIKEGDLGSGDHSARSHPASLLSVLTKAKAWIQSQPAWDTGSLGPVIGYIFKYNKFEYLDER